MSYNRSAVAERFRRPARRGDHPGPSPGGGWRWFLGLQRLPFERCASVL